MADHSGLQDQPAPLDAPPRQRRQEIHAQHIHVVAVDDVQADILTLDRRDLELLRAAARDLDEAIAGANDLVAFVRYDRAAYPGAGPSNRKTAANPTPPRLYNLGQDDGEASDLAAQHPAKAAELMAAWQEWNAQLARPLWGSGTGGGGANSD